jgi:hypothetical protein
MSKGPCQLIYVAGLDVALDIERYYACHII